MFKFQIAYFFYEDSDDVLAVIMVEPLSLLLINILGIYLCNSNQISFIFSGCITCVLCVPEAAFDTISIM